jgi:hypothetical protein
LCGTDLRFFDHASAVGSTIVNINAQPALFIAAMLSYATMSAADNGFDPSSRWTTSDGVETVFDPTIHPINSTTRFPFIRKRCARRPADVAERKLWIHPKTLSRRLAIKTRGSRLSGPTTATSRSPVVKDQWRTSESVPEGAFLALALQQSDSRSSSGTAT